MSTPLFASRRDPPATLGCSLGQPAAEPRDRAYQRGREAAALLLIAAGVYGTLALASFRADPALPELSGPNWVGPVGASVARAVVAAVGVVAWAAPAELLLMAFPLFRNKPSAATVARIAGDLIATCILAALVHVALPEARAFGAMPAAGSVGELFGELMRALFSTAGSFIIGLTSIGLILIARCSFSFIAMARSAGRGTGLAAEKAAHGVRALAEAWSAARAIERKRAEAAQADLSIPIRVADPDRAVFAVLDEEILEARSRAEAEARRVALDAVTALPDEPTPDRTGGVDAEGARSEAGGATGAGRNDENAPEQPAAGDGSGEAVPAGSAEGDEAGRAEGRQQDHAGAGQDGTPGGESADEIGDEGAVADGAEARKRAGRRARARSAGPTIVDTSDALTVEKASPQGACEASAAAFALPAFDLLDEGKAERLVIDQELEQLLNDNARLLVTTLNHYGVSGQVREIQPGPTVTTYELEPDPGTKVSKIASLADDLALNLGCQVRIIAPIPGKKRVGFEVPNRTRKAVNLRELIEDRRFQEMRAPLPVVLGRDIVGAPFYADLASMPHVLVAGATGAGKSVGLNVMLVSLLYRRSPEELRMLMIDPKVVELQAFDRIPHMLLPVVTDMRQASNALKWAVDEMERRYQLLANAGTKNITTYNAWVGRVRRGEVKGYEQPKTVVTTAPDGSVVEIGPAKEPPALPEELPFIVIVVDEFADLMMQQGKDVEACIARLAQKARAAGMHVILATQRPSVDVITGMIKANFPTRVAFKVTQRIDSRTILDEQGAEHLLGRGDMLVKLNGTNEIKRVQCPFVSEEEVERVAAFLRRQGEPSYDESILRARDDGGEGPAPEDAEQDPKYDEAVRIVAETRRCSTSWLQRKLGIGYNRAANIVEMMEKRGLVGPANGARERDVLVDPV
jgi:S-DNA-T family DNA segregation ATPase FtsK/SpoIIIE